MHYCCVTGEKKEHLHHCACCCCHAVMWPILCKRFHHALCLLLVFAAASFSCLVDIPFLLAVFLKGWMLNALVECLCIGRRHCSAWMNAYFAFSLTCGRLLQHGCSGIGCVAIWTVCHDAKLNGVARFKQCFCIIQAYYKHLDMFFRRDCRKFKTSFWKAAIISVTWGNKIRHFRVSPTVVV